MPGPSEESIFYGALDCATVEDRAAFLARECGADADLRRRVEDLLRLRGEHESFLAEPAALGALATPKNGADLDASGTTIGRYRLLQRIGEGGFGAVYMAEQTEPVRRRVALKVVKAGMDTRQVIARFEAERQALAMMEHPNIARVLDAGATDASCALGAGRPYFVMELVKGVPITRFCDEMRLGLRERLALLVDACHAVQHAHQKGIIHRDLKPSNVLVSRYDDRPVVKIIDFGIAKATGAAGGRLTDKTFFTGFHQLMGTPTYMSPEQAGMSDLDIDTRSDIYALGVLLYELLTGTTPLDATRLVSAGFDEMRRIIREEDPPRPSTRLGTLPPLPLEHEVGVAPAATSGRATDASDRSDSALEISRRRSTDLRSLTRLLHGDLDWIAMKALEKDRTRRYDTATDLAQDLGRFLRHEPVVAGPPGRLYRLRKFVRRNRALVTGAVLVGTALLAGIGSTTYYMLQAQRRSEETEAAREQTEKVAGFQARMLRKLDAVELGRGIKAVVREEVSEALAREYVGESPDRHRRTAEEIAAKLQAFDDGADAAHAVDVARGVLHRYVLAPAAESLEEQFAGQPLVRAPLHDAIGRTYAHLGLHDEAEDHLGQALELREQAGAADAKVAGILFELAKLRDEAQDRDEAEQMLRRALAIYQEVAPDSGDVAAVLEGLGVLLSRSRPEEAERLCRRALAIRRQVYGDDDPTVALNLTNLARAVEDQGRGDEAEELLESALAIHRAAARPNADWTATTLRRLARMYGTRGDYPAAEELIEQARALMRERYGRDDLRVARLDYDSAIVLRNWGRHQASEELLLPALETFEKAWGREDPRFVDMMVQTARLYEDRGDHEAAERWIRDVLEVRQELHGADDPMVVSTLFELGRLLRHQGRRAADEAESVLGRVLELLRGRREDTHPGVVQTKLELAIVLASKDDRDRAEALFVEVIGIERSKPGEKRKVYMEALTQFACFLRGTGAAERALEYAREAVDLCRRHPGDAAVRDWGLSRSGQAPVFEELAYLCGILGLYAEGEAALREAIERRSERHAGGQSVRRRANDLLMLGNFLSRQQRYGDAEQAYRDALQLYRQMPGGESASEAICLSSIAAMLDWQDRPAEALEHYRASIRIMEQAPPGRGLAKTWFDYAGVLRVTRDPSEAERAARASVAIYEGLAAMSPRWGEEHRRASYLLAEVLVAAGKPAEAIEVATEFVERCRRSYAEDELLLARGLANFGQLQTEQGEHTEAETALIECLRIRDQNIAPDARDYWLVWNARSLLGGALSGQAVALVGSDPTEAVAKLAAAAPLLVDAGTWMTENAERIPEDIRDVRLHEALQRVVTLYESWQDADPEGVDNEAAAEWRARLALLTGSR